MTSLTDLYNDEWYTCINDDDNDTKNKLKFYRKFKKVNEREPYRKICFKPYIAGTSYHASYKCTSA